MAHLLKATCLLVTLVAGCLPTHRFETGVVPAVEGAALAFRVVPPITHQRGAPTIIVLHGGPGATHEYLRPEWDRLAAAGRVIYYDQRGCGGSTRRGPYSWQGHVRDLDAVVDHFAPRGERVILAGSSWGSWLALLYTYFHPDRVRALVLSGTVRWPGAGVTLTSGTDSAAAGIGPSRVLPTDTLPRIRVPLPVPDRFFTACRGVTITRQATASMPALTALAAIDQPVLFLAGRNDGRDGSDTLSKVLRAAQRVIIPDAGHDPWLENADSFFLAALSFLRPIPSTSSGPTARRLTGVAARRR